MLGCGKLLGTKKAATGYGSNILTGSTPTASSDQGASYNAAKAIDGNTATWWNALGWAPQWIKFDLGAGVTKIPTKYTIYAIASAGYNPKSWTFDGSNDNSNWTTMDTQTNISNWATSSYRTFTFSNTTAYRYLRLYITLEQGANYVAIFEMTAHESV
jgi:hypothetical protein